LDDVESNIKNSLTIVVRVIGDDLRSGLADES
jgi:hypothetical protein